MVRLLALAAFVALTAPALADATTTLVATGEVQMIDNVSPRAECETQLVVEMNDADGVVRLVEEWSAGRGDDGLFLGTCARLAENSRTATTEDVPSPPAGASLGPCQPVDHADVTRPSAGSWRFVSTGTCWGKTVTRTLDISLTHHVVVSETLDWSDSYSVTAFGVLELSRR